MTISVNGTVVIGSSPGLSNPMIADWDLIVGGAGGTPTRLAAGAEGKVLTVVTGMVRWETPNIPPAPVVPWTAAISTGLITTTNDTPTVILGVGTFGIPSGVIAKFTISAIYRDLSAMYAWDVLAAVTDDGAGTNTLRSHVITATDGAAPISISVSISSGNIAVTAVGLPATVIDWDKTGTITLCQQGV